MVLEPQDKEVGMNIPVFACIAFDDDGMHNIFPGSQIEWDNMHRYPVFRDDESVTWFWNPGEGLWD